MNIKHGIDLLPSDLPMRMRLASHQRTILISAVSPDFDKTSRATLEVLYKYTHKSSNPISNQWGTTKEAVKKLEKANNLRLKQLIYDAEQQGVDFVNNSGDINSGIKAAWDIKNAISTKTEESKNFKVKEYMKMLKGQNVGNSIPDEPYSRNMRIFRDNFLFEKFQTVAGQNPTYSKYGSPDNM
jgi:predicted secreted Zn-dependent protease